MLIEMMREFPASLDESRALSPFVPWVSTSVHRKARLLEPHRGKIFHDEVYHLRWNGRVCAERDVRGRSRQQGENGGRPWDGALDPSHRIAGPVRSGGRLAVAVDIDFTPPSAASDYAAGDPQFPHA